MIGQMERMGANTTNTRREVKETTLGYVEEWVFRLESDR